MELCLISRSLTAILTLGLLLLGPVVLFFGDRGVAAAGSRVVGGPCSYKDYPGQARILSIQPAIPTGETGRAFEVRYSFHPQEKISEPFAQTEGRTFLLTMKNGTLPNQKFLDKYRIETGRILDCTLKVIVRGTCTPTLFEFAGIDLGDYGAR